MKRVIAIVLLVGGCGGVGGLSANEAALVADGEEVDGTEEALEAGLEEPLSGSMPTDPGSAADSSSAPTLGQLLRERAPRFFTPAGCLTIVVSGNTATATFDHCTGPFGRHSYHGVVTSTWTPSSGKLTVTHQATGFRIDGATLDHHATIEYTRDGDLTTRHRSGTTTGSTARGAAIDHSFDFTAVWDSAQKCIARDGVSSSSVGQRSFERTISGYRRCGVGSLGCPQSGTVVLTATGPLRSATLTLEFLGGRDLEITRPNGSEVHRTMICNP